MITRWVKEITDIPSHISEATKHFGETSRFDFSTNPDPSTLQDPDNGEVSGMGLYSTKIAAYKCWTLFLFAC